jgi:fumarate reductase flavoprotein subunit
MYIADDATPWHVHADLAVVGGSGGGLLAAIAAAGPGCRVILVERTKELGGNLARGAGMVPAAGTRLQRAAGIEDTPEAFANDVLAQNRHQSDPERTGTLCREAAPMIEWLADRNVTHFEFVPRLAPRGHAAPRMHVHARGAGAELSADLVRAVTRNTHVSVRAASVVEDLWVDQSGAVVGIAARERRGPINIGARRVLLACGGFGANAELVGEYQAGLAALPYAGVPGAMGDGLRWGLACGAAAEHLGACRVTPLLATPGSVVVSEALVLEGGIIVNQLGHRFEDETTESLPLARTILAQPGKVAYLVFDERIYRTARETDPYFARVIVPRATRRANALADLARHFEIDADNLALTLENFQANVELGSDPFGREVASAPFEPPFYGVRITGARLQTQGGLRCDTQARVMRVDGTAVANLYAAGGVVADISGAGVEGYLAGNEVLTSLVWGWIAGRAAAAELVPPSAAA